MYTLTLYPGNEAPIYNNGFMIEKPLKNIIKQ